jgi:Holliday junction resolvase RusA-like endonuclease
MEQKKNNLFPEKEEEQIINFKIRGKTPSKSNSYKIVMIIGKGRKPHASLAKTKALKEYEQMFFMQFPPEHRELMLDHYFKLEGIVYYPSNRADLDNSLKVVLDCLQKVTGTIKNDNKCININIHRAVDKTDPRIEMRLVVLKHL